VPRFRPAASIRSSDDLEQMTVGIIEVDATTVVPGVEIAEVLPERIRPVGHISLPDASEYLVEFGFSDEKGTVLPLEVAIVSRKSRFTGDWRPSISAKNDSLASLLRCLHDLVV